MDLGEEQEQWEDVPEQDPVPSGDPDVAEPATVPDYEHV